MTSLIDNLTIEHPKFYIQRKGNQGFEHEGSLACLTDYALRERKKK